MTGVLYRDDVVQSRVREVSRWEENEGRREGATQILFRQLIVGGGGIPAAGRREVLFVRLSPKILTTRLCSKLVLWHFSR